MKIGFDVRMLATPFEAWRDSFWTGQYWTHRTVAVAVFTVAAPVTLLMLLAMLAVSFGDCFYLKR